jgi:hypothetical protein
MATVSMGRAGSRDAGARALPGVGTAAGLAPAHSAAGRALPAPSQAARRISHDPPAPR